MNHRLEYLFIALTILLAACGKNEQPIPEGAPVPESAMTVPIDSGLEGSMPSLEEVARQAVALTVAGLTFDLPPGWIAEQPSSMMRLAQYRLPGDAGAAELTVFSFGPVREAMSSPISTVGWRSSNHRHGIRFRCSVLRQRGSQGLGSKGPGELYSRRHGAHGFHGSAQSGAGPLRLDRRGSLSRKFFIKVIGPEETLRAHDDNLQAFAKSVRRQS